MYEDVEVTHFDLKPFQSEDLIPFSFAPFLGNKDMRRNDYLVPWNCERWGGSSKFAGVEGIRDDPVPRTCPTGPQYGYGKSPFLSSGRALIQRGYDPCAQGNIPENLTQFVVYSTPPLI
jgi:hypothetical protein